MDIDNTEGNNNNNNDNNEDENRKRIGSHGRFKMNKVYIDLKPF